MSPDAREDLKLAIRYYERQRRYLGRRFVAGVVEAIDVIVDRPNSFPLLHDDVRRAIVSKFPYGVFFRLPPDTIRIIGIIHLHRDPRVWRGRR